MTTNNTLRDFDLTTAEIIDTTEAAFISALASFGITLDPGTGKQVKIDEDHDSWFAGMMQRSETGSIFFYLPKLKHYQRGMVFVQRKNLGLELSRKLGYAKGRAEAQAQVSVQPGNWPELIRLFCAEIAHEFQGRVFLKYYNEQLQDVVPVLVAEIDDEGIWVEDFDPEFETYLIKEFMTEREIAELVASLAQTARKSKQRQVTHQAA